MGKKYIIEKDDNESIWSIYADADGDATIEGVSLTPYTEPDIDAIRKEAYDQGRKDGKIEGQAEAWVCVKKIALHPEEGGIALGDIRKIFGCNHFQIVFRDYSASEAIEKIRQYEQEKEEIKVGDEVEAVSGKAVVVYVDDVDEHKVRYVYSNGVYAFNYIDKVTKTGRHFPEIAEVLQKMKEK